MSGKLRNYESLDRYKLYSILGLFKSNLLLKRSINGFGKKLLEQGEKSIQGENCMEFKED